MNHETTEVMETLKGYQKVDYDIIVKKQQALVDLLGSKEKNSKEHKAVLQIETIKLKEMCEQGSEWAIAAFPEEYAGPGSGGNPHIYNRNSSKVFEEFEFIVMVRKK
jgi:hypothetical protein